MASHSRGMRCPSVAQLFTLSRGRRESRVRAAPAVSRANAHKECAHEHTGSAEAFRPSLRNGFTAYLVLSPVNRAFLPPSPARLGANLTPASGFQDHTPSPVRHPRVRLARASRPPHLTATSLTIAARPSFG